MADHSTRINVIIGMVNTIRNPNKGVKKKVSVLFGRG
jgi:hypothetical protein